MSIGSKIANIPHIIVRKIERWLNQTHCYDYPPQNNGWIKNGKVYGDREIGTMFDPYAFEKASSFVMLVSERKTGSLITVESEDGLLWQKHHVVLSGIKNTWEDIVNRGCMIEHGGRWHLWYTGQYKGFSSIGYATSNDGLDFTRISENPVLAADLKGEGLSVMNPCVIWDDTYSKYRMWYSAGENYEPDVICYAESIDGIIWTKREQPVLKATQSHKWEKYKVGGCQVIKVSENKYEIYYIGYQNVDVARICFATSSDGINWVRDESNLLLSPSKDSWDANACYKPSVINTNDKSLLWYNGRRGHDEYIGLAQKG